MNFQPRLLRDWVGSPRVEVTGLNAAGATMVERFATHDKDPDAVLAPPTDAGVAAA